MIDKTMDAEVLIVGGGMVGTTLAVALASAGVSVAIIDRDTPERIAAPARDGRASAIASGSQAVLDVLGVWPRVARAAQPILEVRVSDTESLLFLHYDHRNLGDRPLGAIVENHVIRGALNARLAELLYARVIGGRTVATLERDAHRAVAVLDDGTRIAARLAIAADGRTSPLRRQAGIDIVEWTYPQTGIVCTVRHERDHRGIAHERFLPAGPFAILPLPGRRASLVWTERADIARTVLALDDAAFAAELALRFGDFLGALEVEGQRYAHPLALLHAQRYIAPRLALAGDAAHAIHPIAGQGLNLGLRDVAALAEVIVDALRLGLDPGSTAVLLGYERWRRFDNTVMMAVTDSLNRLFSNRSAPIRLARDAGLAAVNQMPALKRLFMRHAMGLVGDLPRLVRGQAL
jgi:2-octaprenyl-6-methoxyphenol hydroxylase